MKKLILTGLIAGLIIPSAFASTGGIYTERNNYTNRVSAQYDNTRYENFAPRFANQAYQARPCAQRAAAQPISVKTHTEVINHYQMYQPVTVYQPAGTYAERQIIQNNAPCNRCN